MRIRTDGGSCYREILRALDRSRQRRPFFSAVPDDYIVEGNRVVSLGAYAGVNKTTGKAMRAPFTHVWQVADAKLARFDMYADALLVRRAME